MEPVEQTGLQSEVFRAHRAENQPECLPTAYKPQLITRRSLVQVQPPQPNKKGTSDFPGCFCFRNYDGKNDLPHSDPVFRGTPENCSPQGRFPHKRPLPCCEKGGRNGESTALRLLTQKPMKPWFHRFFSFCPESLLTHTLTQTRKGPVRFRKRPRGHSPSHQLPAAGLWWSHGHRCPG